MCQEQANSYSPSADWWNSAGLRMKEVTAKVYGASDFICFIGSYQVRGSKTFSKELGTFFNGHLFSLACGKATQLSFSYHDDHNDRMSMCMRTYMMAVIKDQRNKHHRLLTQGTQQMYLRGWRDLIGVAARPIYQTEWKKFFQTEQRGIKERASLTYETFQLVRLTVLGIPYAE